MVSFYESWRKYRGVSGKNGKVIRVITAKTIWKATGNRQIICIIIVRILAAVLLYSMLASPVRCLTHP